MQDICHWSVVWRNGLFLLVPLHTHCLLICWTEFLFTPPLRENLFIPCACRLKVSNSAAQMSPYQSSIRRKWALQSMYLGSSLLKYDLRSPLPEILLSIWLQATRWSSTASIQPTRSFRYKIIHRAKTLYQNPLPFWSLQFLFHQNYAHNTAKSLTITPVCVCWPTSHPWFIPLCCYDI